MALGKALLVLLQIEQPWQRLYGGDGMHVPTQKI